MGYKNYNDYELLVEYLENDEVAEKILMDKYRPLIFLTARDYQQYLFQQHITEFEFQDFLVLGNEVLTVAARKYDVHSGVLFYTYFLCCLRSKFNTFCRGLSAKKNRPLIHYQEFEYEVEDFCAITSYLDDNPESSMLYSDLEASIQDYLFCLPFDQQSILELRFNGFAYKEIESLLCVSNAFITKTIRMAKRELSKIIN